MRPQCHDRAYHGGDRRVDVLSEDIVAHVLDAHGDVLAERKQAAPESSRQPHLCSPFVRTSDKSRVGTDLFASVLSVGASIVCLDGALGKG